jgi:NAD(P)-dependent dehydrogenase (short-subunit alcohol dehydrogenase family)
MTTTRVALVTGAGSGMGRNTAEVFLDRGWTVLAVDLTPVEIDGTDGRLVPIAVDVRDRAAVESALTARLPDAGGSIHAVANVAGIYPPSTQETVTTELFHQVFDVNVLGVINIMAAAAPHMSEGSPSSTSHRSTGSPYLLASWSTARRRPP